MEETTGTDVVNPQRPRGIVFVLDRIPFDADDDFSGAYPLLPLRLDNLAAAYQMPLTTIADSSLNKAGMVEAVYINFRHMGCFQIDPLTDFFDNITPRAFENMLGDLFRTNSFVNPNTNREICRKIDDIPTLFANLPADTHVAGCFSGENIATAVNYRDYISAASDDETLVFVVGDFSGGEVEAFVDTRLNVSEYSLDAKWCLARICGQLERKWNI